MTCNCNCKRFGIAALVGFIFVFGFDFVVHGILLLPTYDLTPDLWRPMEEYESMVPFMTAMQVLTTVALCYIYTRNHEGTGISEGIRFGIMFGIFLGLMQASSYAWLPISAALAGYWFVAALVKTIGLGVIFSLLYKD